MIYKAFLGHLPNYLCCFIQRTLFGNDSLRSQSNYNLCVSFVRTELDKTSFKYAAASDWNLLQGLSNDSECCGTTGLQWAQKNPCYTSLHLTALATSGSSHHVQDTDACIQNNHRLSTTSTHYYESTSPPEVWDLLVSDALWYHHREAQNHSPEHSHSPFLDGGIIFPPLSGMLDPCQSSNNNWRLISFGTTWLHPKLVLKKKKKKKKLSLYLSLRSIIEQWKCTNSSVAYPNVVWRSKWLCNY